MNNLPRNNSGRGFSRESFKKPNVEINPAYREVAASILAFVRGYWLENGYSPSMDEIGSAGGFNRTSAYYWVHRMREKGDLLFEDKVARSFRLPGQTVNFPDENEVL